ncbi:MAG: M28 family metallopeptidase [Gemmatimonadota bacterium]
MRRLLLIGLAASMWIPCVQRSLAAQAPAVEPTAHARAERTAGTEVGTDWETAFRAMPDPGRLRAYMKQLSARPHHLGSAHDRENAEWILSKFREWGLDAKIERFDVLFPTPKRRVVEMVEPTRFTASLREPALDVDPTSGQQGEQLPTYNAYSADGDVTAPLVFVNYGIPSDYERLERLGVSVEGKIVIARYGRSWRGVKPKVAAEHGAVGCLLYSDPRDDGYFGGDVFPAGPMRPEFGVQRGSVLDITQHPGDPLTPGVGATDGVRREPIEGNPGIQRIPVLPLSYADARPLLAAIGGPLAPPEWRGGLPITYHVGPGPATVHLAVESNWDIKPVYDVIARIPGALYPDEWIVRGNHHDAWVNGAQDPISGLIALLEEARGLGRLLRQGWRPRRTIIYAAWDGEEPMLLGSTEWAEEHGDELREHAVLYINTDVSGRGYLRASGSHTLQRFVNRVAEDIHDPESGLSVRERRRRADIAHGSTEERARLRHGGDVKIGPLGSGSDYTAFLDHLGVASLNLEFAGEDDEGIYHSIYDDFYWFTHFSDVDFAYGRALAQTVGSAVIRLADAELLPYDFTGLAETVSGYVKELKELLKSQREKVTERNRQIDEGVFTATLDPRRPTAAPDREEVPPHLNFAPLDNAVDALGTSARAYEAARKAFRAGRAAGVGAPAGEAGVPAAGARDPAGLAELNELLIRSERRLTSPDGLPGRAWYKHLVYAPGEYSGYGAKTIPGVREAIELKRYDVAEAEIARAAGALEAEAELIRRATELLKGLSEAGAVTPGR